MFTAFKYYDLAKGMTVLPGAFLIAPIMANKRSSNRSGPSSK